MTLIDTSNHAQSEPLALSVSEGSNLSFLRRSLESIKEEMALGTPVDLTLITSIEAGIAALEAGENRPNARE